MERDARLVNWQPETIEQAEKVNARHLALYGIEYDSDGATQVSRKIATREVAREYLGEGERK